MANGVAVTTKLTTNSTARELAQQLKFKAWCSNPSASANSNSKQRGQLDWAGPFSFPKKRANRPGQLRATIIVGNDGPNPGGGVWGMGYPRSGPGSLRAGENRP